jgi:hypothetical protein
MTKRIFVMSVFLLFCLSIFTGCSPVLPNENIRADYTPNPLVQGASAEIEITYPDTVDTSVVRWVNPWAVILSGEDVISISGLTVTGLNPGTAMLRVFVYAHCEFLGFTTDRPVFATELEVKVE